MRISDDLRDRPPPAEQNDTRNVLLIVSAAMALIVLNATGLNVALPAIGEALGLEPGPLGWVQTIYLLVYGVAIPLFGAFADVYGARRFFVGGLAVYAVGSLLCALATAGQLLLAARVIQAAGGAAVSGLGFALVSTAVPPERRGFAFGIVATSLGAAGIAGPLLAGVTADELGWPAVFVIGALAGLLVPWSWKLLPRDMGRGGERPDLWGGLCLALAVAGALYAATEGAQTGLASTGVGVAGLVAVGGLIGLVTRQRTVSTPFIPRDLVDNRAYLTLAGTSLLTVTIVSGVYVGMPLLLTAVNDLPLTEIGLVLVPGALLSMLLGVPIGHLVDRTGTSAPVRFGLLTILAAVLGLSSVVGASIWVLAGIICLLELGSTLVTTALTTAISLVVRPERLPSAQSMNAMLLSLGGGLGTTLTMSVLSARATADIGLNPFHTGSGVAFSDSLLLLAILPLVALAVSRMALPHERQARTDDERQGSAAGQAVGITKR